jgi:hypothetical protein
VCILEIEHWCCLDFIYTERGAGGSRGLGNQYGVTFPHCHPVPSQNCSNTIAVSAIQEFKCNVAQGLWKGPVSTTTQAVANLSAQDEEDGVGIFVSSGAKDDDIYTKAPTDKEQEAADGADIESKNGQEDKTESEDDNDGVAKDNGELQRGNNKAAMDEVKNAAAQVTQEENVGEYHNEYE